jgi:hypothetical protein
MDPLIEKYKSYGSVYIWQYREKNPKRRHWNLTADEDGCSSLIELLELMQNSRFSSKKLFKTTSPTNQQISIPNNRNPEWHSKPALSLRSLKENNCGWMLTAKNDSLEIVFCKEKLSELMEAIVKIKGGDGDFAISDDNDNNVLYFWWNHKS